MILDTIARRELIIVAARARGGRTESPDRHLLLAKAHT
jgi:hypothetical protein